VSEYKKYERMLEDAYNTSYQIYMKKGGDPSIVDNPDKLPQAKYHIEIKSTTEGFVNTINAEEIGIAAMLLGAGRKTKEDVIDHAAGITIVKKIGDKVNFGDTLCVLHTNKTDTEEAETIAKKAFYISALKPKPIKYVYDVIK